MNPEIYPSTINMRGYILYIIQKYSTPTICNEYHKNFEYKPTDIDSFALWGKIIRVPYNYRDLREPFMYHRIYNGNCTVGILPMNYFYVSSRV